MEGLRARNLALESDSSSLASKLEGLKDENQILDSKKGKTQLLKTKLITQLDLVTAKEARILVLDIGLTKSEKDLSELNAKYKELQAENISQSNYILEQQTTIAKGIEESGRLRKDLKKVQDTLASVEQSSAKKDEEILHLRSQFSESKYLTRTQRGLIDVAKNDKNMLREQISALEANVSKLKTEKRQLKAQRGRKQLNTSNLSFQLIWLLIGQGPRRVHSSIQ